MSEFLVTVNRVSPASGAYKDGDPVLFFPDGHQWGKEELNTDKFIRIGTSGFDADESYLVDWKQEIDFDVVVHQVPTDGFRIDAFAVSGIPPSGSISRQGIGSITRAQAENHINNWGGVVFSASKNSVIFDYSIETLTTSDGFWSGDVSSVVFNELNYDSGTGDHRIEADYSATGFSAKKAEGAVLDRNGSIFSHDEINKVITYDINRNDANAIFKQATKEKLENFIERRRFNFAQQEIDDALANSGMLELTEAQFDSKITNKLDD